jgi:MoxR-like ATPase
MAKAPWATEELYSVARRWVDNCLRRDGSLFTPDAAIWAPDVIDEAAPTLLIEDTRKLDFITKLHDQLEGKSDAALQFTSELLYIHALSIGNMGIEAKRALVEAPLVLMNDPTEIPHDLIEPLAGGVANYGAGLARRDAYMRYFVGFARDWKALNSDEQSRLLGDSTAFRSFLHGLGGSALMQREAILHLVDPETFEYALAPADKARIARTFAALPSVSAAGNDDEALSSVRGALEVMIGRSLNLYSEWFRDIWQNAESDRWAGAVKWGEKIYAAPNFDLDERDYKLVVAERMRLAREAVERGDPDWPGILRAAFQHPNNLTHWRYGHGPFLAWCDENAELARGFLLKLWNTEPFSSDELSDALSGLPKEVLSSPAARLTLASVLLFGVDATRYPPYKATAIHRFMKLVGADSDGTSPVELDDEAYTPERLAALLHVDGSQVRGFLRSEYPRDEQDRHTRWELTDEQTAAVLERFSEPDPKDSGQRYTDFISLLDEFRVRLLVHGVELRDRLDAQSIAWWIASGRPPESWTEDEKEQFLVWYEGDEEATASRISPPGEGLIPSIRSNLAADLFVSEPWLQEIIDLLNQKRQVIFYGPPGTGKTYIAQALGGHVEEAGGTWRLVQFHPAYSYEDFFEGYRPLQHEEGGALQFRLRHGPLREMADMARKAPDVPYLLVIDEINRGNLPKIFGELYFLLEYRDREVRLQYSPDDEFSLPENLFFIGTMNTADRSIALVDSALRRRFYFVSFLPQEEPIDGVLASWLAAKGFDEEPARLLEELNAALSDRDGAGAEFAIGPSYFMAKQGPPDIALVWKHAILPLLEERFYGALSREQIEDEYGLAGIRARFERLEAAESEGEESDEIDQSDE